MPKSRRCNQRIQLPHNRHKSVNIFRLLPHRMQHDIESDDIQMQHHIDIIRHDTHRIAARRMHPK